MIHYYLSVIQTVLFSIFYNAILAHPASLQQDQFVCISGFLTCSYCNIGAISSYNTFYNEFQAMYDPEHHNLECLLKNPLCISDGYEVATKYSILSVEKNVAESDNLYCRSFHLSTNSSSSVASAGLLHFNFGTVVERGGLPVTLNAKLTALENNNSLAVVEMDALSLSLNLGGCTTETIPDHCIISSNQTFSQNSSEMIPQSIQTSEPSARPTITPSSNFPYLNNANEIPTAITIYPSYSQPKAATLTIVTASPSSINQSPSDSVGTDFPVSIEITERKTMSPTLPPIHLSLERIQPSANPAQIASTSPVEDMKIGKPFSPSTPTNSPSSSISILTNKTALIVISPFTISPTTVSSKSSTPTEVEVYDTVMNTSPANSSFNISNSTKNPMVSEVHEDINTTPQRVFSNEIEIKRLFKIHGKLALTGLGILLPLAMAVAWFRDFFPPIDEFDGECSNCQRIWEKSWFAIHVTMTIMSSIITSIAGYFGIKALSMEGGIQYAATFVGAHRSMGLFLIIGIWIQVIGGVLRPKQRKKVNRDDIPMGTMDEERLNWEHDDSSSVTSASTVVLGRELHRWRKETGLKLHNSTTCEIDDESHSQLGPAWRIWKLLHRLLAIILLICGVWQVSSGCKEYQERYQDSSIFSVEGYWIWVGIYWFTVLILSCFFKRF